MQCLFPRRFPDIHCAVTLISDRVEHFTFSGNEKAVTVLDRALSAAQITDCEYFSLQFSDRHKKKQWLRLQKALYPQWRDTVSEVVPSSTATFHLKLAVKFYPNDPCRIRDPTSRYFLFLQVRHDLESGRMAFPPEDVFVELCGMILQSDLGDSPVTDLTQLDHYLGMTLSPAVRQKIFHAHSCMRGRVPDAAEYMFLDKVKWLDAYGSVSTDVLDEKRNACVFSLRPTSVYVERGGRKILNVFWPSVTGFAVRKCCVQVKVRDRNVNMHCFYTNTKEEARNLWRLCEEHHAFFKKNFEIRCGLRQERKLMRSSSSSASIARLRTSNFDEENRAIVRSAACRAVQPDQSESGSVLSTQAYNHVHPGSTPTSPQRRPSIVSDHLGPPGISSPKTAHRPRAVHLSDVENDSYFNSRSRPMVANHEIAEQQRVASVAVASSSFQNGLNGSLHSLQSDPVGGPAGQRKVKRRRRPTSPPGRAGPPPELLHHILFEPIEPPSDAQEIPYTVVQTNAEPFRIRYSPRMKQRGRSYLKPAPPTTEILPHASGPVAEHSPEKVCSPDSPERRAVGPQNSPYITRNSALSPVEAINRYASSLRAKQQDFIRRGAAGASPKSPRRPPPQMRQPLVPPPPPPHGFHTPSSGAYTTSTPALHNASYHTAITEHGFSPGRPVPRRQLTVQI